VFPASEQLAKWQSLNISSSSLGKGKLQACRTRQIKSKIVCVWDQFSGLCESVEVGVAKLLKYTLRDQWESWILEEEEVNDRMTTDQPRREPFDIGTTVPPKGEQSAMWVVEALQSISQQKVQNAWRRRIFGWFTEEL